MELTKDTLIEGEIISKGTEVEIIKVAEDTQKLPKSFSLSPAKMAKIRLPADIRKKGIDSPEYKEWIYNNWRS